MKRLFPILVLMAAAGVFFMAGCDIVTENAPVPDLRPASTVVVNEVFSLPLSDPATYSWIEFLNPTDRTINLTYWTLTYTTFRGISTTIIEVAADSSGDFQILQETPFPQIDTFGVIEVPFAGGFARLPGGPTDSLRLEPNGLFTIVNIESRLEDNTKYGPGDETFIRQQTFFRGPISSLDTLSVSDTTIIIAVRAYAYGFFLQSTDQLVLKDETGRVVDVVRYGNYVYPGPGPDPYAGNQSIGVVPRFESIFRYAGGYYTGNSASDFSISTASVRPIPHWYSQLYKLAGG